MKICSQLIPRVAGSCINLSVKVCDEVIEHAIISEGPPLRVDAHSTLISLHQIDVSPLLHVAGVRTCAWSARSALDRH